MRTWVCAYVHMNVRPVRMCVRMNVLMYVHTYVCTYVRTYICDPVRLRLRHLYQVEFCSFIVKYPTAGASVYCGHISSLVVKFSIYLNRRVFVMCFCFNQSKCLDIFLIFH